MDLRAVVERAAGGKPAPCRDALGHLIFHESLIIKRQIQVIAIVTEALREELVAGAQKKLKEIEESIQRSEVNLNRTLIANPHPEFQQQIRQHFQKEKESLFGLQKAVTEDFVSLKRLEDGDRIHYTTIDSQAEWRMGQKLQDVLWCQAIMRDGELIEVTHDNPEEVIESLARPAVGSPEGQTVPSAGLIC